MDNGGKLKIVGGCHPEPKVKDPPISKGGDSSLTLRMTLREEKEGILRLRSE